mmetsp:Transcript_22853/g.38171  ORF Transcript_22853/g.38171 Transcript_22853/m.38171 type:complete len:295 (-) Transcript_22853:1103-1987(-)
MRALLLLVMLATPGMAHAWWALWTSPQEQQEQSEVRAVSPLDAVRDEECGALTGSTTRFGQTAFMRGAADKSNLPESAWNALAGLSMATSAELAEEIAAPLLASASDDVRATGLVALARWLLAHDSALGESARNRAAELLSDPLIGFDADAHVLRATIELGKGQWLGVALESAKALALEPEYYDAQVLGALASLQEVHTSNTTCIAAVADMEDILLPVLTAGACPTHVAHLDLAISRYVPTPEPAMKELRELLLAYVAHNDSICQKAASHLLRTPWGRSCGAALERIACTRGNQ